MYKLRNYRLSAWLALFFGMTLTAVASDEFFVKPFNIEPGETKTISFMLEGSREYFGFQADINLPEGMAFVETAGKPDFRLSERADEGYTCVSNVISESTVRLGAFSITHTPFSTSDDPLFFLTVKATDDFKGGTLSVSNLLFVDAADKDVEFPDCSIEVGNVHRNVFYIPDFRISVGETKTVSLILENETAFTAFQTDIYLPEGLQIVSNSFVLTSRGSTGHTIAGRTYPGGLVRVICHTLDNQTFTGDSGALVTFEIMANKEVAEETEVWLKNQIFSTSQAHEYVLPDSKTTVETERIYVEEVILEPIAAEVNAREYFTISATVLPENASTKELNWTSSDENVAIVSQEGIVTGVSAGDVIITATAIDGSGVHAVCEVKVNGVETGIDEEFAELTEEPVVEIYDKVIVIKGFLHGTSVDIFGADGKCLYSHCVGSEASCRYEASDSGLYIIRVDQKAYKIYIP